MSGPARRLISLDQTRRPILGELIPCPRKATFQIGTFQSGRAILGGSNRGW